MKFAFVLMITRLIWLFSFFVLLVSHAVASDISLRFVINSPGSPPYIYFNSESNQYQGVVVDFFESFDEFDAFNVEYIDSSRARNERLVQEERADLYLGSSIWTTEPDRFIYSDSIMSHNSYIYATSEFTSAFVPEDHGQAHICTRHNFVYPILDRYFEDSRLIRVDSSSQMTMAYMLSKGRCHFAIMSEENARAIMSLPEFCSNTFYQSPVPFSEVNIGFVMGRKLAATRARINQQISVFIKSGDRDKSVQRHVGADVFPKRVCTNIVTQAR